MSKKVKKRFKSFLRITPKLTLNSKITAWRQRESNNITSMAINRYNNLLFSSVQQAGGGDHDFNNFKEGLRYKLWSTDRHAALSFHRNHCYYIGRARSTNRKLFMARHTLRKFTRFGILSGFIKERC